MHFNNKSPNFSGIFFFFLHIKEEKNLLRGVFFCCLQRQILLYLIFFYCFSILLECMLQIPPLINIPSHFILVFRNKDDSFLWAKRIRFFIMYHIIITIFANNESRASGKNAR